jgi:hypothetical protein
MMSADRSFVCNQCGGLKFETAEELTKHNRQEHHMDESTEESKE